MKKITYYVDNKKEKDMGIYDIIVDENGRYKVIENEFGRVVANLVGDLMVHLPEKENLILISQTVTDKKTKEKKQYLTVIDKDSNRVIADKMIVSSYSSGIYSLLDPKAPIHERYHLLDTNCFRENEFKKGYFICKLLGYVPGDTIFTYGGVIRGNAYSLKRGKLFREDYDGIAIVGEALVTRNLNQKRLVVLPKDTHKSLEYNSPSCEKIWADQEDEHIIYCQMGDYIRTYFVNDGKCLNLFDEKCSDLEVINYERNPFASTERGVYTFRIDDEGHYGLSDLQINFDTNITGYVPVLPVEYEWVEKLMPPSAEYQQQYSFEKDDRKGLVRDTFTNLSTIPCKYKSISSLTDRYYLATDEDNKCSIYDMETGKITYSGFELVESEGHTYIIRSGNTYGLMFVDPKEDDVTILDNYSHVYDTGNGVYYVKDLKGNAGIVKNAYEIIKPEYESVYIEGIDNREDIPEEERVFYFTCTNLDGSRELFKYSDDKGKVTIPTKKFKAYKIWHDFVLCYDKEHTYVYDLDYRLICTLNVDSDVKVARYNTNGKPTMYKLGDDLVTFIDGKLKPVDAERLQTAVYEGKYGYVVVNEYRTVDYLDATNSIDNMNPREFETILSEMYDADLNIQDKYPNLKMKK